MSQSGHVVIVLHNTWHVFFHSLLESQSFSLCLTVFRFAAKLIAGVLDFKTMIDKWVLSLRDAPYSPHTILCVVSVNPSKRWWLCSDQPTPTSLYTHELDMWHHKYRTGFLEELGLMIRWLSQQVFLLLSVYDSCCWRHSVLCCPSVPLLWTQNTWKVIVWLWGRHSLGLDDDIELQVIALLYVMKLSLTPDQFAILHLYSTIMDLKQSRLSALIQGVSQEYCLNYLGITTISVHSSL